MAAPVEMLHTKSAPLVKQVDQLTGVPPHRSVNAPFNKTETVTADISEAPYRSKSDTVQSTHESKPINLLTPDHASGMGGDCFSFEQLSENSLSTGNSIDNMGSTSDVPVCNIYSATAADTELPKDVVGDSSDESVAFHSDVQRHDDVEHDVRASQSYADLTSSVGSMGLDCAAVHGKNSRACRL